ncbi:HIRAN domain-containing protein [uncultured Metabacillus sp.]|uniref:HIRAN domain-containing protein n=1 Tax=uncultured Metabacillus sp. TaxID=2860135 RepID=UPI00260C02DA|nr:HIRAN domain-containing protein [uncultured Metabacillus sp.]
METYPIIDVSDWQVDAKRGKGTGNREKIWLIEPNSKRSVMFKLPREDRGEHWAEKLCYEIANVIDFPCAEVDLAIRNGRLGSISYFFVDEKSGFSHYDGGTFFPYDYDHDKNKGYNIQLINQVLKEQDLVIEDFLFCILFDALVANGDRHQDNWGITRHEGTHKKFISPLYDNSASLGRDLNITTLESLLKKRDNLIRYIFKGKSKIGYLDKRQENHFSLVRKIFTTYVKEYSILLNQLVLLTDSSINTIVEKLPKEFVSNIHKEFLKQFIMIRRDILIKMGDNMISEITDLLLIWKDPETRSRFTVGKLTYNKDSDIYKFYYKDPELSEAVKHRFQNYPNFPNLKQHYEVKGNIFPSIKKRLPQPKRPDYGEILIEYGLNNTSTDMEILEATRGRLATDTFEFVKEISYKKGQSFEVTFDLAGARYADFQNVCDTLKVGDTISMELDPANEHDDNAVMVLSSDSVKLGYVPKYYSCEFKKMILDGAKYTAKIIKLDISNSSPDEWAKISVEVID